MENINIEEQFYQELKDNIDTNLIFADIEIMEYYKEGDLEYLKIELPFTTTGNILTYQYNTKTDELLLIDATIYSIEADSDKEPYIDKNTILKIYKYCRQKEIERISSENKMKIDDGKMNQLYDMIIDEVILNNENLYSKGFTKEEIDSLIKDKILKLTENNEYILSSIKGFYRYGVKLLLMNSIRKANICFQKCHELDPTDIDSCLQIFYSYICVEDYNYAIEIISYIESINCKEYQSDIDLYLYILNRLTNLPEEYKKRLNNTQKHLVLLSKDSSYQNETRENEIRIAIMKGKYKYALNLLNNILATESKYIVRHTLLKKMILQVIASEEKFKSKLTHFAKTKRYILIISFLENKMQKRRLNYSERCIYLITKEILEITKNKTIPMSTTISNQTMYDAIVNKNYEEARQINLEFIHEHRLSEKEDITNLLLTDLSNLISEISEEEIFYITNKTANETENASDYDTIIKSVSDIAYYINGTGLSLEESAIRFNLSDEYIQLIKLIYARDNYIEGMYRAGDRLIQTVENSQDKTPLVVRLLNEIKTNREKYKETINPYTKKKINTFSNN